MPLAITDYLPTIQQFLQHWTDAETELGKPIVLNEETSIDTLRDLHEAIATAQADTQTAENARQAAIQQRERARKEAIPTGRQVRKAILGLIPDSDPARQLPAKMPALTDEVAKQLVPLQDVQAIWTEINASPTGKYPALAPPLVVRVELSGKEQSATLAQYQGMVSGLSMSGEAVKIAEQSLTRAQQARKKSMEQAKAALKRYRSAIKGLFPNTSVTVRSLPTL